jgi:hypothetical protein
MGLGDQRRTNDGTMYQELANDALEKPIFPVQTISSETSQEVQQILFRLLIVRSMCLSILLLHTLTDFQVTYSTRDKLLQAAF